MAKKKEAPKAELERTYNVPLRKEFQKAPKHKRAKKAVTALKEFAAKHMKTDIDNVKIGNHLNLKLWEKGIKNPPHHVKTNMKKFSDGKVEVEIVGAPVKEKKPEAPKKESKTEAPEKAKAEPVKKEEAKEEKPAAPVKEEAKTTAPKAEVKPAQPTVKPVPPKTAPAETVKKE